MTAASIVSSLGGRRGRCVCPVCEGAGRDAGRDHLSVSERNGRVLVHCFSGCEQRDVIQALRARGLWPEPQRKERTPEERRRYAEVMRQTEVIVPRVRHWLLAKCDELETAKREAIDYDAGTLDVARLEQAATLLRRLEEDPEFAVQQWHRELCANPRVVRAMEAWGRRLDQVTDGFVRLVVDRLAEVDHAAR